ncbi:tyrosine-type recombinase/integrase [Georgenia sp. H159]|uniref:tyrosine-type recombinase/integrase n=1 Tax=Georgenia sp. H159 TaxID=3076115 RepID=UPI002D769998|nr:tyrosine-type recombinase/integrase [Georgenia sp. H159]
MATGSRRGFGNTERRKNARTGKTTGWRARYFGPDGGRYHQTFTTKLDAEAWLHCEEALIARGEWLPPDQRVSRVTVTLNEYIAANLSLRDLAPRTREEYESYVERFLAHDELGRKSLRAISARDITSWYTRLQDQTGKTMTARVYGFLSSVFNAAVRDRLIDHNPCTIRGASEAPRRSKKTIATPEQIAEALLHLDERYRAMILLAAWSGLRSGEFRNLRRRNIDLVGRRVVVDEQIQNLRGQGKVVRAVKTEAGARIVHLPASVTKVLATHMAAFSQAGPDGLVFPSHVGTPISQSVLHEVWDEARRAIGRPDLRIHDLRATAATQAARTGATIAELQARLGHTTPNAAMKYQTAAAARDAHIADALDDFILVPIDLTAPKKKSHAPHGRKNSQPNATGDNQSK